MPRRYFRLRERSHFQSEWNEMRRGAAQIDMHSLALLCGTCESPLAESNLIWFGANHIIASLLANWPLGDLLLERWRGCLCTDADISGLRWGDCEEVNGKHFRRRHYSIQHTYSPPMRPLPPALTPPPTHPCWTESIKDLIKNLINTVRNRDLKWVVPISKGSWGS